MATRGERRHLVTLQTPGPLVPDPEGGWVPSWVPLDPPTWWVSIEPAAQRDMERLTAGTSISTGTHLVEGDYHPGVFAAGAGTQTQVLFEGRTLHVSSLIDPGERHQSMTLVCQEIED